MKIRVTAKPNAKKVRVEKIEEDLYRVWVKASPQEGHANDAILGALADYLGVAKSKLQILQGKRSKQKVVAIKDS